MKMKCIIPLAAIFLISSNVLAMEEVILSNGKKFSIEADQNEAIKFYKETIISAFKNPKEINYLNAPPDVPENTQCYSYQDRNTGAFVAARRFPSSETNEWVYWNTIQYHPKDSFFGYYLPLLHVKDVGFNLLKMIYESQNLETKIEENQNYLSPEKGNDALPEQLSQLSIGPSVHEQKVILSKGNPGMPPLVKK